jgi:glycosyltransferase involved in cell wall biosynthesis
LNVRIVCPDFTSFGGSQLAVWYLARHLRAHDHAVRVLSFTADEMPGVEIRRVRNGLGSGLTRILKLRRSAKGELRSGERRYATGPDDPTADVVTFHACAQSRLEAISNGRIRFSGSSFRDLLRPVYHRGYLSATAFMERRIVRRAMSGQAVLTAVSTTLADQIRNAYAEDVRIDVTPNGVDRFVYSPSAVSALRPASRSKLGLTNDDFVVGFVGGDWHRKNLRTFIRAVHAARKRIRRVIGIVLGNGDPAAFATEPGIINDEIRFAGVTRSPVEFYSAMDVFYSPSPVESFGLPALEAMACGIPVVVCAGVGLLDFLNPGDAVVLSDAFDCEAASMILARLCEDVPFRSQLSKAGAEASARLPWARGAGVIEARLMAV